MILGSTPVYAPGLIGQGLGWESESQSSGGNGFFGEQDVIRFKRAWMSWNWAHLVYIDAGRMPNHFGLGMTYNDGNCLDCDFGDHVDRLGFSGEWNGIRTLLGYDFLSSGIVMGEGGVVSGQPVDGTRVDDGMQFTWDLMSAEQRPLGATAEKPLDWRWGWRNVWRTQDLSSDAQGEVQTIPGCNAVNPPGQVVPSINGADDYNCIILERRDAWLWNTSLYGGLEHRLSDVWTWGLETELGGALMGEIGRTQGLVTVPSDKEIWATGGILRAPLEAHRGERSQLEIGWATGDELGVFGVLDASTAAVTDAVYQSQEGLPYRKNNILSSYLFNRAYHLDLLLFREVIGAVTNTVYVQPGYKRQIANVSQGAFWAEAEAPLCDGHDALGNAGRRKSTGPGARPQGILRGR